MKITNKIIFCLIILIFYSKTANAVSSNRILFDNRSFNLSTNLLEPIYLENNGKQYLRSGSDIVITDINWYEYASIYEIEGDTLFLRGIATPRCSNLPVFSIKELFGEKCQNGKVKAVWFTGELGIPEGKTYKHILGRSGREYYYEKTIALTIEAGKIIKKTIIDNVKNEAKTEAEIAFTSANKYEVGLSFGEYLGKTIDELIKDLGEPTRQIQLNKDEIKIFYGRIYAFLFKEKILTEIHFLKEDMQINIDSTLTSIIDPDESLFGIPYGTKMDDFLTRFGKPTEYVKFDKNEIELMYGKIYAFLFKEGSLSGVRLINRFYDNEVSQTSKYIKTSVSNSFDYLEWKLSNGITKNTSIAEAENILGKNKGKFDDKKNWEYAFTTERALITLVLSGPFEEGQGNKQIYSISVRLK